MTRSVRDPLSWAGIALERHYCPDGYDLWGHHRDGGYNAAYDRAPRHETPHTPTDERNDDA